MEQKKLTEQIAAHYLGCKVKVVSDSSWTNSRPPFYTYEPDEVYEINAHNFSDISERIGNFKLILKYFDTSTDPALWLLMSNVKSVSTQTFFSSMKYAIDSFRKNGYDVDGLIKSGEAIEDK